MTLNVNGFRGHQNYPYIENIYLNNMVNIKKIIDNLLINDNDIIILQEVPHKIKQKDRWVWYENPLYNKFIEVFKEYKILKPKHLINSWQCTVAICRESSSWEQISKDTLKYDSKFSYGNKIVELQCEDISLIGVHMNPSNEMWSLLISALEFSEYTFIVGDFNANEKNGEMSDKPNILKSNGYNAFIPNNIITYYPAETSIDNIYINRDYNLNKDFSIKVKNTKLTDHALCIFEYGNELEV